MKTNVETKITLRGHVVGTIWMPACDAWKDVTIGNRDFRFSDGGKPTARDFALQATCDGDFRHCKLTADSEFTFRRDYYSESGRVIKSYHRTMPVTAFKSLGDMVDERELCEVQ